MSTVDNFELLGSPIGIPQMRIWLKEMKRLERKLGRLPNDEEILEEASDLGSPLHDFVFHISEPEVLHNYYIDRIQHIMRTVAAICMTSDGSSARFRMFLRTEDGYVRATDVRPGSATAERIATGIQADIASACRRAKAWRAIMGEKGHRKADALISQLDFASQILNDGQDSQVMGAA